MLYSKLRNVVFLTKITSRNRLIEKTKLHTNNHNKKLFKSIKSRCFKKAKKLPGNTKCIIKIHKRFDGNMHKNQEYEKKIVFKSCI